jgi:hypothetical protein
MSTPEITLRVCARALKGICIEQQHARVMERMTRVVAPLGFSGLSIPAAPDCGKELTAHYTVRLPTPGVRFLGSYVFRGERYAYTDRAIFDDTLRYDFKLSNKRIDYKSLIHIHYPKIIEAFNGYRAFFDYDDYVLRYACGGEIRFGDDGCLIKRNPIYNRMIEDTRIDIDGRNNIYTLQPAQYWDATLCRKALGYSPTEVITRLQNRVPNVEYLMDGVYIVLNDEPRLSYDFFLDMNNTIKSLLGLI